MTKISENPGTYGRIGTADSGTDAVPIPSPGIGTRIGAVAELIGTRKSAASAGGVSADALQRYIREENAAPFEVLARLCAAAGASLDWLSTGKGAMRLTDRAHQVPASQDRRPDPETLKAAVEVLERALETAGATTDAAGRAELLVAVYELLEHGSALDAAERIVASMLRVASGAGRTPAKQG